MLAKMQRLALALMLSFSMSVQAKGGSRVVDLDLIDRSMSPCEDFFQYACGEWLKKTEIPADRSSLYRFSEIDINTESLLRGILEKYQKGQYVPAQKDAAKLGAFYQSCMNETASNQAGQAGVKALLTKVQALQAVAPAHRGKALAELLADLHKNGIEGFFSFYVDQDPGDARQIIPQIDQGGLGLPEKNYYFDTDAEMKKTRTQYLQHLTKMLKLAPIKFGDSASIKQETL